MLNNIILLRTFSTKKREWLVQTGHWYPREVKPPEVLFYTRIASHPCQFTIWKWSIVSKSKLCQQFLVQFPLSIIYKYIYTLIYWVYMYISIGHKYSYKSIRGKCRYLYRIKDVLHITLISWYCYEQTKPMREVFAIVNQ